MGSNEFLLQRLKLAKSCLLRLSDINCTHELFREASRFDLEEGLCVYFRKEGYLLYSEFCTIYRSLGLNTHDFYSTPISRSTSLEEAKDGIAMRIELINSLINESERLEKKKGGSDEIV